MAVSSALALSYDDAPSGGRALARRSDIRYIERACFNLSPGQGRAIPNSPMDPAQPE